MKTATSAPTPATADGAPPPGTKRAATHARICDAANTLFFDRGFSSVTMEEIAQAAGIRRSTLYLYFRDKDEILAAIARVNEGHQVAYGDDDTTAELAEAITADLDAGQLPDLDRLRERFLTQTAAVPEITIQMPALDSYDELARVVTPHGGNDDDLDDAPLAGARTAVVSLASGKTEIVA